MRVQKDGRAMVNGEISLLQCKDGWMLVTKLRGHSALVQCSPIVGHRSGREGRALGESRKEKKSTRGPWSQLGPEDLER